MLAILGFVAVLGFVAEYLHIASSQSMHDAWIVITAHIVHYLPSCKVLTVKSLTGLRNKNTINVYFHAHAEESS